MAVVTTAALFKGIKRAQTAPPFVPEFPEWFKNFVKANFFQLTNQANFVQSAIQAMTVSGMAGGAGTAACTLPVPYPDANYVPVAMADWATIVSATFPLTKTGFTLNFSVVTPGATNHVWVLTIR